MDNERNTGRTTKLMLEALYEVANRPDAHVHFADHTNMTAIAAGNSATTLQRIAGAAGMKIETRARQIHGGWAVCIRNRSADRSREARKRHLVNEILDKGREKTETEGAAAGMIREMADLLKVWHSGGGVGFPSREQTACLEAKELLKELNL